MAGGAWHPDPSRPLQAISRVAPSWMCTLSLNRNTVAQRTGRCRHGRKSSVGVCEALCPVAEAGGDPQCPQLVCKRPPNYDNTTPKPFVHHHPLFPGLLCANGYVGTHTSPSAGKPSKVAGARISWILPRSLWSTSGSLPAVRLCRRGWLCTPRRDKKHTLLSSRRSDCLFLATLMCSR